MKKMTLALTVLFVSSLASADLIAPNQFIMIGKEAEQLSKVIQNINGKNKDDAFEANAKIYCYKRPNTKDMRCSIDVVEKK